MTNDDIFKIKKGKKNVDQREMALSETTCYIYNGLRYVNPYHYLFYTNCKNRWIGLKLVELFEKEFTQRITSKIIEDINKGSIRVNGKIKSPDYKLKNSDIIQSLTHRHEMPISFSGSIDLIYEDEKIIVVDKPSGFPIHPMGRYRHNTLLFYLYKEMDQKHLYTIHRLDRLTSGVTIIAKDSITAQKYSEEIIQHNVEKEYYCMVDGEFPENEIICEQPIKIASIKLGICIIDNEGKYAKTIFQRIRYNNERSIIKCIPITGRMHQIRIHMQWLGFPIIGDPIYNHPIAFGTTKGYNGVYPPIDDIISKLLEGRKFLSNKLMFNHKNGRKRNINENIDNDLISPNNEFYDENCLECTHGFYATDLYRTMCLHSKKYKVFEREFNSQLPKWYHSMKISSDD